MVVAVVLVAVSTEVAKNMEAVLVVAVEADLEVDTEVVLMMDI